MATTSWLIALLRHAGGVVQRAEDQVGAALVVGDDLLLDVLMDRASTGAHEAGAHVDAVGAQRQRGDQAAGVGEAAGGDHRDLHLVGGGRNQDEAGDVVLARVAGALEAVDADRVDADPTRAFTAWRTATCTCGSP
jgi:hypothetical protein